VLPSGKGGNTIQGMKRLLRFLSIALLTPCLITPAHAQATAPASWPQSSDLKVGLELLTDTNGVNIDSYVKNLISDLKKHWLPLVKEAANQRPTKPEETTIGFTIGSDGSILAMQLEDSTHNTPFDKAAWSATKGTTYLPPPAGMKDPNLKVRVHFVVN
jgi:TonB family protein